MVLARELVAARAVREDHVVHFKAQAIQRPLGRAPAGHGRRRPVLVRAEGFVDCLYFCGA